MSRLTEDGLEGEVLQIEIAHTQWVGETREHDPDPDKCWCWPEYEKRFKTPKDVPNDPR